MVVASKIAARAYKPNLKGATMQATNGDVLVRLAFRPNTKATWPDECSMSVGPDADNLIKVLMKRVQCCDCAGTGLVTLFVTTASCDRCLGSGQYAEGRALDE